MLNIGVPDPAPGRGLARYEAARAALAAAHDVDEVKEILDKAEAMRVYARQACNTEMERWAVEIRLRAEHKAGRLLAEMAETGQREKQGGDRAKSRAVTLRDLGVSKMQASRWQASAKMPEADFEAYLASHDGERMPSSSGLRNRLKIEAARQRNADETGCTIDDLEALAFERPGEFASILVDVPSEYKNFSEAGGGRSPEMHYQTMTVEELIAMGPIVRLLAAPDCALFYWTSGPNIWNAHRILEAWGDDGSGKPVFRFSTNAFTWVKTNPKVSLGAGFEGLRYGGGLHLRDFHRGNGHWTAANPELCLLLRKGAPPRLDKNVDELVIAPVGAHSAKPQEVHARIERLVGGPYLELFAREAREGWACWGNEIPEAPRAGAAPGVGRRPGATKDPLVGTSAEGSPQRHRGTEEPRP